MSVAYISNLENRKRERELKTNRRKNLGIRTKAIKQKTERGAREKTGKAYVWLSMNNWKRLTAF